MPDNRLCELKHVTPYCVTLKCCVKQCISIVCDTEKHNGVYQNKKVKKLFTEFRGNLSSERRADTCVGRSTSKVS